MVDHAVEIVAVGRYQRVVEEGVHPGQVAEEYGYILKAALLHHDFFRTISARGREVEDAFLYTVGALARASAENVRRLLLEAPFGPRPVLGVDPGVRTGAKVAVGVLVGVLIVGAIVLAVAGGKGGGGGGGKLASGVGKAASGVGKAAVRAGQGIGRATGGFGRLLCYWR